MQGFQPFAVISIKPIKRKNMKRTFKTLVFFLSAIFLLAACSSDDETEMKNTATEGVVYAGMMNEAVQSSPLSVFMSKELRNPSWDGYGNKSYTFFDYALNYRKDTCLVINSMQEFQLAYHGHETLPEVDFTNNTLLIFKTSGADSSFKLGDVALKDQRSQYELQYKILNYINHTSLCMVVTIFYWRLCPKLQNKPIVMKRKVIDVDD